ncbi:heavy-metal-associated domain-containing protein [Streptomyces sp. WM6378]|uniref:heavy-metal-associated domain-containing protein n=1 Tax=Streptomyces sp. WM6378 TaxID=1415557 RepID=UPI0006AE6937|nr:heavy metal-associated domain-containing protein [Streptomyces sp. WM6378]KOU38051.1 hypothetical protein ADK54_30060 [Streptomyces sp. WM6378]
MAGVREVTVDLATRTVVVDAVEGADADDAEAGYGVVEADADLWAWSPVLRGRMRPLWVSP